MNQDLINLKELKVKEKIKKIRSFEEHIDEYIKKTGKDPTPRKRELIRRKYFNSFPTYKQLNYLEPDSRYHQEYRMTYKDVININELDEVPYNSMIIKGAKFEGINDIDTLDLSIFDNTQVLGPRTFENKLFNKVIFPSELERIEMACFSNCKNLSELIFNKNMEGGYSLSFIGQSAFYCTNLTSIIIPDSVTFIGNFCFCNCRKLTNVIFPASINFIGIKAFYGTNLSEINLRTKSIKLSKSCFGGLKILNLGLPMHLIDSYLPFENSEINNIFILNDLYYSGVNKTLFLYKSYISNSFVDALHRNGINIITNN